MSEIENKLQDYRLDQLEKSVEKTSTVVQAIEKDLNDFKTELKIQQNNCQQTLSEIKEQIKTVKKPWFDKDMTKSVLKIISITITIFSAIGVTIHNSDMILSLIEEIIIKL